MCGWNKLFVCDLCLIGIACVCDGWRALVFVVWLARVFRAACLAMFKFKCVVRVACLSLCLEWLVCVVRVTSLLVYAVYVCVVRVTYLSVVHYVCFVHEMYFDIRVIIKFVKVIGTLSHSKTMMPWKVRVWKCRKLITYVRVACILFCHLIAELWNWFEIYALILHHL